MEKTCRKCGATLPLESFYKQSSMADGHLNICKECVKVRVRAYREKNIERIREYDRKRGKNPERIKKQVKITNHRRHEVSNYMRSHNYISKAIASGKIQRLNYCEVCGRIGKTEGHHYSYAEPKYVIWLCPVCHKQYHLGKSEHADMIREAVDSRIPF